MHDTLRELPMGFGLALMQNERAYAVFSAMNEDQKKSVIEGTHHVQSKNEMKAYVDSLATRQG